MSDDAKTLLHYAANWREPGCADDPHRAYCFWCAREWAAHIIGAGVEVFVLGSLT